MSFPGLRIETSTPRTKTCPWGPRTRGTRQRRHFGVSKTACSIPLALFASQRICPELLIATASVRVNPVPAAISEFRFTKPLDPATNGTCFPGLGGWYCVCGKKAVPTIWPEILIAVALVDKAPLMAPRSVQTLLVSSAACAGAPEAKKMEPAISQLSLMAKALTALAPAGTGSVVILPPVKRNSPAAPEFR